MASTSAPFGLRPSNHSSGQVRPKALTIATGYATAIYHNQPVKIADGVVEAAAVNDRFIGTFQGVQYTDSGGRPQFSPNWIASTAGTGIVAYVTMDPLITYEIQSNAAMTVADIGAQYDFTAAAGSTATGLGAQMLDVASVANNAALRVIDIAPYPNNAWGDTYVIVLVQISEHQNVADIADY